LALGGNLGDFTTLALIIERLRAPDGCPWDRQQTHASLKGNLVEELYEVLDAIDKGDSAKLCEELGDLLMQVVLHARIASEAGEFDISDVVRGISEKLIRRHPHVFGNSRVADAGEVVTSWEKLKREEREPGESLLSSVPRNMPSLAYSQTIQRRAARVGFDWKDIEGVMEKIPEEFRELCEAREHEQRVREFGDLLFALANLARWMDIDLEGALRGANERFRRRFSYMEEECRKRGILLSQLSFEEQNKLWEEAKRQI